jgi:predicted site-specific integrase-resolvase
MTDLLTTADLAARYAVSPRTVNGWCRRGRFPNARKKGRDWWIPETDLEGFVPPARGNRTRSSRRRKDDGNDV